MVVVVVAVEVVVMVAVEAEVVVAGLVVSFVLLMLLRKNILKISQKRGTCG